MNKVLILTAMLMLPGCSAMMEKSKQEQAQREANIEAERLVLAGRIVEAEAKGSMICIGKEICEKAFKLTKLYIMQNADYKISRSDDMSISTHSYNVYNIDFGYEVQFGDLIYMSAVKFPIKSPDKDIKDIEKIAIKVDCGKYYNPYRTTTPKCVDRVINVYKGFKPYVESRL